MRYILAELNGAAGSAIAAVLNNFWLALVVVVLVCLALRFATRINAATRYAIWWATLGVVLVLPFTPLLARMWYSREPARVTAEAPAVSPNAPLLLLPPVAGPAVVIVEEKRVGSWPLWVLGVWAAVLLFRLAQIGSSWIFLFGVKRRATISGRALPDCGGSRPVRLLLSREVSSPMAVGFLKPAVILPKSVADQLKEPDLDHVLLHELAHIARFDDWTNLAARLAGAALSLHPVALWILRQIEREREMACDDFVVAQTGAVRPYAESLARLFEMRLTWGGEVLASGIFGRSSKVGDRIEMLLKRGRAFSPRVSLDRVMSSGFVLLGFVIAGALAPRWIAFAQQAPRFEVVSIKSDDSSDPGPFIGFGPGGRLDANAPLKVLIGIAYNVQNHQISGGPSWLESAKFNIEAKPEGAMPPPGPTFETRMRLMLQSILEDRFKLALHRETREEQVYELVVVKGGSKLTEATETLRENQTGMDISLGQLTGSAAPIQLLAAAVSQRLGRPVIDKTGLKGRYDFTLTFSPDTASSAASGPLRPDAPPSPDTNGPSIFAALQEQLGLRLKSARGPVDILVIDHAEKPDGN